MSEGKRARGPSIMAMNPPCDAPFCETGCYRASRTGAVSRAPRARIEGHGDPRGTRGERPDPAQRGGAIRFSA